MKTSTHMSLLTSLLLLGACVPDAEDATSEGAGDESTSTEEMPGGASETSSSTEPDSDPQATDPGAEATDTDTDAVDTDAVDTDDTDTDADTDADTGAPVGGCECAASEPCSVQLCPSVNWVSTEEGESEADTLDELEVALTCALTALRDGKAGRIEWDSEIGPGYSSERGTIEMFGDGTARFSANGTVDICSYWDATSFMALRSPTYFSDCLAEPDPKLRFECVRGTSGIGSNSAVCGPKTEKCDGI